MPWRARILIVAAAAAALLLPAAASANTETATLGNVTAELSYTPSGIGYKDVREKIVRGGITLIDQAAGTSAVCPDCTPGPAYGGRGNSVNVVQLDTTPEPEVIFDLYTGGAHCCFYSQIFRFDATGYVGLTQDWLDPGYALKDLNGDGLPEFVSEDGRFSYVFGSFAGTRFPPQIWRYDGGMMTDVTRQFPALVSAAAGKLRRLYKRNPDRLGLKQLLLGYTADECLLGSCSTGFKLARTAAKRGKIEKGAAFVKRMARFLAKTGYLRA